MTSALNRISITKEVTNPMTQKDKLKWKNKNSLREMTSKYNQAIDLLGNTVQNGTVVSEHSGFSEVQEWEDGNSSKEDRIGYFVSLYKTDKGIRLRKATSNSFIRGVTVASPAFSCNEFSIMRDDSGMLLPQFTHVVFAGIVPVIDNGSCTEGGYCLAGDDGTAVPTDNPYGYKVVSRIDSEHIYILVSPQTYELARLRDECSPKVFIQEEQPDGDQWIWIKPVSIIEQEPEDPGTEEPDDTTKVASFSLTNDVENSNYILESEGIASGVLNIVDSESELSNSNYIVEISE